MLLETGCSCIALASTVYCHKEPEWFSYTRRLATAFTAACIQAMPAQHDPADNHLLAALAPDERDRIFPHLQSVDLRLGEVLYESGDTLRHVYFPTDSIVSLLYVLIDGESAEIAVAGNEGLIGISLFMGGEP